MPITGYLETASEVLYTIEDHGSPVQEQLTAREILATRPWLVELYQYKTDVTQETRLESRVPKVEGFPKRSQMMIIDYFEVEHYNTGMQLIENAFVSCREPPFPLLVALVNFILQPKTKFKRKQHLKDHWLHCKRAHTILLDVLHLFGPDIYLPLFNQFRNFQLISIEKEKDLEDDDYDQLDTKQLQRYDDFWKLADHVFNTEDKRLEAKCRRLVLDLFVNIMQVDLKSRVDNESKVRESIFVRTLRKDAIGRVSKYDGYLRILLRRFPNKDGDIFYLTGDILNMFVTISCFERVATMNELVNQVYIYFQEMKTDACQQLMQLIKYPSFLIALCDKSLSDTNVSQVPDEFKHFRKSAHRPLSLEKLFFYAFKTLPLETKTLEGIYRHVAIVSKYCMCALSTATVSHKRNNTETNTALPDDQLELLILQKDSVVKEWEDTIEGLLSDKFMHDVSTLEKIRWSIKLARLTLTEYF